MIMVVAVVIAICNYHCNGHDILAVVTLQTFYLGKFDLLTVYLRKLDF